MAESDFLTLSRIHYYMREKYYSHAQTAALDGLRKYGNDSLLKYYVGVNKVLEGRIQEGISDLDLLKDKRDVNVCSLFALIAAHKLCKTVDREAVQALESRIKEERKQAGEMGLLHAGQYLLLTDRYDKAKEYIDRSVKMNGANTQALAAKGWLEMLMGKENNIKKASKYFDEAIDENAPNPDVILGQAKAFEMRRNFTAALDMMNQAVVSFQHFLPALIEKMKLQMALQDWDQVLDTAQRALTIDSNCIEAKKFVILHKLVKESDYEEAASDIGDLLLTLDRVEPKNALLYANISATFVRVCGRNPLVLQQCYDMVERATSIDKCADYYSELGYQQFLKGDVHGSLMTYNKASKYSDASTSSMTGMIRAQLIQGNIEEARSSLEFLNELNSTLGQSAEVLYLSAILDRKKGEPSERVVNKFNEAINMHFQTLKGLPLGFQYYHDMNPELVIRVISDLLEYAPQQPAKTSGPPNKVLRICGQSLEALTRVAPGIMEGSYLLGKVKYLAGDTTGAQKNLALCLEQDSSYTNAHILMAQLHLSQGNFKLANQSLEVGLSYNFEVRDHPVYHLIKSRILRKQGDIEEAKKTLIGAMALPGVKLVGRKPSGRNKRTAEISVNDRVSVFLELADAHIALNEQPEAAKVMQDAIAEFEGTPEEVRISISNADLAINRGDIDGALTLLRNIGSEQAYFVEAREKMAHIYLHQRKDPRLYAGCYRELVEINPTTQTQLLLGDAYMAIQEPDKAIEVYETALKRNPRDGQVASRIGQALVKTHFYSKAITYYEASLKGGGPPSLKYDLAELLLKLRMFEKCEKILTLATKEDMANDLESIQSHTKYLLLLSKVYKQTGRLEQSLETLNNAKETQVRAISRAQMEAPDTIDELKKVAASICAEMALQYSEVRDYEKAIRLYKEATNYYDSDGKHGLQLAHLLLLTEDLDSCQHQLMQLLKYDKENEKATVMMADLMFRKNEYDQAMHHFQQLLDKKPDHWEALSRLIDLMRRAGRLAECNEFIKKAETTNTNAEMQPGFNYCKGLHAWYTGEPNAAIKLFNMARKDSDFGHLATYCLIEICLNPDNATVGGEVLESVDPENTSEGEAERSVLAIKTAEKLLRNLKARPGDIRPKLLENMALIQTKSKSNIEKSLQSFMEIASEHVSLSKYIFYAILQILTVLIQKKRDHSGALYGVAAAYMMLKQQPRARNQLKRLAKAPWNMEDAEDLEKAWILLADIYIQSGKYDMATESLKRVLQYNKSCCKAYEYMGFIMEKEQSFKNAADNYELAWKFGNRNNPQIGYKLGFNYIKAKRYVDAIDIAHHVMKIHPNYPKIRKDILEKARANIRT